MKNLGSKRVCLLRGLYVCAVLLILLLPGRAQAQQGYQRFGRVYINTHGAAVPNSLVQYLAREGELLIVKNRALGFQVPQNFYYQIEFFPDVNSYMAYSRSIGQNVGPGGGYTLFDNITSRADGDIREQPKVPLKIVCYWHHDRPWNIVPILLHEMCHAVHGADYGAMPLWLQEGLPNWFSHRKQHLGVDKKIENMKRYPRYMKLVQEMDERTFIQFIASTQYEHWQKIIGDVGVGYFLAETLVDFFIGNPSAQPFFKQALVQAKAHSPWQFERSINCAANIEANWPQGIPMLLKGWKSWYKKQAQPKKTNELNPFVDANREHFHKLLAAMRAKQAVTDADRYAFVSHWLAFTRLEVDDLALKRAESYHRGETDLLRARLLKVQQFAAKDHSLRLGITQDHRNHLVKTRPNGADPLYKKTVPYQPVSWYLGIDPVLGKHARPAFLSGTQLPPANFRWQGLDAWQANMIFTNLFTSYIGKPPTLAKPTLKAAAKGPFTEALRKNNMNGETALRAVGGKLERNAVTGEVLTVDLTHARIDNADLEHLAVLFQPRVLDLTDTDITDSAAIHLAGWASLRVLKLGGTRMSKAAVDQIKFYAPGLAVE